MCPYKGLREPEPEGKASWEGGLFALQVAVGKDSGGGDKSPADQPCTDSGREAILLGTISREEPGMWVQPCQRPCQRGSCLW